MPEDTDQAELHLQSCTCVRLGPLQVNSNADPAELQLRLEAHQRMLARWEGKVARQLEKIVTLQRGGRSGSAASLLATPLMGQASAQSGGLCAIDGAGLCPVRWAVHRCPISS